METFSISTWGVGFSAVCEIPAGWRIKAGSSAAPNGVLEGEGSQGATWFNQRSPAALRNLVLIRLYGPVQADDVRNGPDATFKGHATISTEGRAQSRTDLQERKAHPGSEMPLTQRPLSTITGHSRADPPEPAVLRHARAFLAGGSAGTQFAPALAIEQGRRDVLRTLAGSEIISASPASDFHRPNRPPSVTSYRFSARQSPLGTKPQDQVSQPICARCSAAIAQR
jgi:hypothetical protein